MVGDSVAFLQGRRPAGVLRRRALLRRLQGQPRVRPAGARGGGHATAPTAWCCATPTAARCPTRSSASPPRCVGLLRRRRGHRHPHPERLRAARWPTRWPRCWAGPRQVQGTINGYGERTGNGNLMTVIPNLTLKMGVRTLPEGRLERLTAVSHHVAELVNLPPQPADPYVGVVGLRPQGRAAHLGARPGRRAPPTSTSTPTLVGNGTRVLVSRAGRPGRHVDEGRGARASSSTTGPPALLSDELKAPRARGLPSSRRPTPRSSC